MDSCVTAKTNRRVQCKTLSCSAIVSNYKIGDVEYYYAKRGCTADPEASHIEGEQYPADKETVPSGWTGTRRSTLGPPRGGPNKKLNHGLK